MYFAQPIFKKPAAAIPKPAATPAPAPAPAPAAKQKQKPIAADSGIESNVKILDWPHKLDRVQRKDGRSRDEKGKRVFRSQKTFSKEWVEEDLRRQQSLQEDPVYQFLQIFAGLCRADLENDVLTAEGSARFSAGGLSAADRRASRSIFGSNEELQLAQRAAGAAKQSIVPINSQILLRALGKERLPTEGDTAAIRTVATAEKYALFLGVFFDIKSRDVVDARGRDVAPGKESVQTIELLNSTRNSDQRNIDILPYNLWLQNIGITQRELQQVKDYYTANDKDDNAFVQNITYLDQASEAAQQPDLNKVNATIDALGRATDQLILQALWKSFQIQCRLSRAYYEGNLALANQRMELLKQRKGQIDIRDYWKQFQVISDEKLKAARNFATFYIIETGAIPQNFDQQTSNYQALLELLANQSRTIDDILLWDREHNDGRILLEIEAQEQEQADAQLQAQEGGGDWVGQPKNLGMVFLKPEFKAAIEVAFQDINDICHKQDIPQIDIITHKRVRTPFAQLAANHVQIGRVNNPTRNESQVKAQRLQKEHALLVRKFKNLAYSPYDGMLCFNDKDHMPMATQSRDIRAANRKRYQEQTGEYYSDAYNVKHILEENGGYATTITAERYVPLEQAMLRNPGVSAVELFQRPGVTSTVQAQKRLKFFKDVTENVA